MRKAGVPRVIGLAVVLFVLTLFAGCGGSGGSGARGEENTADPNSIVTFTSSLDSGRIDSLPAGADHVKMVLDGNESIAEVTSRIIVYAESQMDSAEVGTLALSFHVSPGEHIYTVYALRGSTVIATIGPITFTKVEAIPVTIPIAFHFPSFDRYTTKVGTDGADTMIVYGTDGKDRIVQYGLAGNDILVAHGNADNDWIEQFGGNGDNSQSAYAEDGDDYVYQEGGSGTSIIEALGGTVGIQTFIQVGGQGYNTMTVDDSSNNRSAYIEQHGGPAGNIIEVTGSKGDDDLNLYGGAGSDSMTYDMTGGADIAFIDGGAGNDLLTINEQGELNYTIKDSTGTVFSKGSGGTAITVANIEGIRLLDENGATLFTWGIPPSPPAPLVPALPAAGSFDTVVNDPVFTGNIAQIRMGTDGKDLITQYGGTGNVTQIASGNPGDDWILQVTGGTTVKQSASAGSGNDTIYQFAQSSGSATQNILGGTTGAQTFFQVGGQGANKMTVSDASNTGSAHIEQYGGPAGNTMTIMGSEGDDTIAFYGGAGNDVMTYTLTPGNDTGLIHGDAGDNTLTINPGIQSDYAIKDSNGSVLYDSGTGGAVITVLNMQHITVIDVNGNTVWSAP